jgi:hypothetical protein
MKNKLKSVRSGSKSAASPQSKTTQSRAKVRHDSGLPLIAFFPEGEESGIAEEMVDLTKAEYAALKQAAAPSGSGVLMFMANAALEKAHRPGAAPLGGRTDCLCMYQCGEIAGEITLVGRHLPKAVIAALRQGVTVDQFIADAIVEKLSREPDASTPKKAVTCVWDLTGWQRMGSRGLPARTLFPDRTHRSQDGHHPPAILR